TETRSVLPLRQNVGAVDFPAVMLIHSICCGLVMSAHSTTRRQDLMPMLYGGMRNMLRAVRIQYTLPSKKTIMAAGTSPCLLENHRPGDGTLHAACLRGHETKLLKRYSSAIPPATVMLPDADEVERFKKSVQS